MSDKIKYVAIAIAVLFVIGVVFGDDDATTDAAPDAPVATPAPAPAPAPEPEPEPAGPPMDLGDDPYLDGLWAACAMDDYDACDDLFWESPLGSEYEAFADERLRELDAAELDGMTDREFVESIGPDVLLSLTWAELSAAERRELCDGVALLGAAWAGDLISEGSGGIVTPREAADFLTKECS